MHEASTYLMLFCYKSAFALPVAGISSAICAWHTNTTLICAMSRLQFCHKSAYHHHGLCRSLGCLDPQCVLCEHNPHRRCNVNFAPKYLVNDILKAKCEAPIRVEIIDRATGVPLGEDIPDVQLEVSQWNSNPNACSMRYCASHHKLCSCHTVSAVSLAADVHFGRQCL